MVTKAKIEWLSVLQGWSMLLVVLGHVTLSNHFLDPAAPLASGIERMVYSFHMPLFIFISGWLFYRTCMARGKSYGAVLVSKLKRLGIPYLFFTLATLVVKVVCSPLVKRQVDGRELFDTFVLFRSNPLGEMWFIVALFVLMLLYPVYRFACRKPMGECCMLLASLLVFFFFPGHINYFQLHKAAILMPFFVMGILCCKHGLLERLVPLGWKPVLAGVSVFIGVQIFTPPQWLILYNLSGIFMSVALCIWMMAASPGLFHTFRDYTFQIFLTGIFFQMCVRFAYSRWGSGELYAVFYVISVLSGIYVPVVIAHIVGKRMPVWIKRCFGL